MSQVSPALTLLSLGGQPDRLASEAPQYPHPVVAFDLVPLSGVGGGSEPQDLERPPSSFPEPGPKPQAQGGSKATFIPTGSLHMRVLSLLMTWGERIPPDYCCWPNVVHLGFLGFRTPGPAPSELTDVPGQASRAAGHRMLILRLEGSI